MVDKGIGCGFSLRSPGGWRRAVLGLCLLLGISGVGASVAEMAEAAQPGPTTVILVRHAEKAAEPRRDPPLTAQGEARARWLGEVLSRAEVGHIYSTDTLRTRSTAGLMAEALGLEVTVLPPRDLEAMAVALRSHPGEVVLSVGHSNTLGPLAELLGGEPLAPIAEDDYEGFYVLTLGEDGASTLPLQLSLPAQKEPAQKSPAAQR